MIYDLLIFVEPLLYEQNKLKGFNYERQDFLKFREGLLSLVKLTFS